jgi:hypothetical protein
VFVCPAAPPSPPPAADRPHYALDVRVQRGFREVNGDVTVRFTPNRATHRLVFRLWPNGPMQRREGSRLEVGEATANGRRLQAEAPDPTTRVLRADLAPGQEITVHLPWRLTVPQTGRDRVGRFGDGIRLGSFFPVLAWDPRRGWVTDRPARILAESSTTPTADFDLHVDVPGGYTVLASGAQTGANTWHARAVRDLALAVGRYRTATAVAHAPGRVLVRVGVAARAQPLRKVLRLAVQSVEALARAYGGYRWSTYSVSVTPDLFREGIEYPTLVFLGRGPFLRVITQHETAHQWFYSLVGNDQARDPWLDEALATWSQLQVDGGVRRALERAPFQEPDDVGRPVNFFAIAPQRYFTDIYGGGVRALASLGPPRRVDCALRLYAARNAFRIAHPGDLLDALNRIIPGAERRLRRFGIHRS